MKRVTYNIIKHIPFVKTVLSLTGNDEYFLCSQMLSDKTFEPILVYMRKHPDIVLTEKLAKQILMLKDKRR